MEKGLISVDRWADGSQVYFLTHLHSDHTQGLSSTWAKGPLYCSPLTAKLFPFKFPNFGLSLLRPLHTNSWHSLSLISPSSASKTLLQVMLIDAHHCPGAVMFLFRGEFGCLLYTGDFRWEANSERAKRAKTMLIDALQGDVVDTLYLDNTYCNPSYVFPHRDIAAQQIVDIIASHPEHDVIIGIDTLGKEDLLLYISRALNVKIWVWPERLQTMHLLDFHDIFTTNTTLTRVRAVPRYSFNINTLEGLNSMRPTIGIMPSGLPWVLKSLEGDETLFGSLLTSRYNKRKWSANSGTGPDKLNGVERFHKYIYSVPYSDHSCYKEIQEFVELIQPTNMKGIMSSSSCYVDPLYYFGRFSRADQPSQRLHDQHESKEGGKRDLAFRGKSYLGSGDVLEAKRKRGGIAKVNILGVRLSRVSALRRFRRGAKIGECDCHD
ncbi:DRMBL domain-containing protein/Lactamase_B_2 domain-containing protein [Cephalotus follicularis]|uniref:Protein artemis n=1 Tax=Cephalotus follicularis TaxID=3775 RepID=A0A1Q3BT73_CEPFO|nr:DRMBL domain-containing protein/Lactamase_B_2 domain-containing protein [Cephalotus follicularis]